MLRDGDALAARMSEKEADTQLAESCGDSAIAFGLGLPGIGRSRPRKAGFKLAVTMKLPRLAGQFRNGVVLQRQDVLVGRGGERNSGSSTVDMSVVLCNRVNPPRCPQRDQG